MKVCRLCGRTSDKHKIVNSSQYGIICNRCYQREKLNAKIYDLPKFGEITYSEDGKPICHICGKCYNKLLAHVWQVHDLSEKEYKKKFGLELFNGIMSKSSKELASNRVWENADISIKGNLLEGGEKTRYKKGSEGRTRNKLCERTKIRLSHNFFHKDKNY